MHALTRHRDKTNPCNSPDPLRIEHKLNASEIEHKFEYCLYIISEHHTDSTTLAATLNHCRKCRCCLEHWHMATARDIWQFVAVADLLLL
jgi:hypothetical protein